MNTYTGPFATHEFIAPEVLVDFRQATEKSDIYSIEKIMNFSVEDKMCDMLPMLKMFKFKGIGTFVEVPSIANISDKDLKRANELAASKVHQAYGGMCQLCNQKKKFCSSHSIPKVKVNEDVFSISSLGIEQEIHLRKKISPKNVGLFRNICNECDSKKFRNYEQGVNIETEEQFREIHLKSELKANYFYIRRKNLEMELCEIDNHFRTNCEKLNAPKAQENDIQFSFSELDRIKNNKFNYKILHKSITNQSIKFYCNYAITPYKDLSGNNINDLNDFGGENGVKILMYCFYRENKQYIYVIGACTEKEKLNRLNFDFGKGIKSIREVISFILSYTCEIYFDDKLKNRIDKDILDKIYNNMIPDYQDGNSRFEYIHKVYEENKHKIFK